MLLPAGSTILAYFLVVEDQTQPWWDYPGLEAWKFFNLLIFVVVMVYFLKRPLTDAFRARREAIQRELLRAKDEKEQALTKLAEVQSRLAHLDTEVVQIQDLAKSESDTERNRIARETELEILKLWEQAQREILSASKVLRHDLRVFAAHQSVKLAEELIRREIRADDDIKLVRRNVDQLGGG